MSKIYKSKKSKSVGIIFLIVSLMLFYVSILIPLQNGTLYSNDTIYLLLIALPIITLFFWAWLSTFYEIKQEKLIVLFGPFRWKVKIKQIKHIKRNVITWAGILKPTLSWRGMEISYTRYGSMFISPEREDEFLKELLKINENIELR
jgi:hypothetical protein